MTAMEVAAAHIGRERACQDSPHLEVVADSTNRQEYEALAMVPADTLNPQKARVLLMLALAKTQADVL